jgi:hypothetical protein
MGDCTGLVGPLLFGMSLLTAVSAVISFLAFSIIVGAVLAGLTVGTWWLLWLGRNAERDEEAGDRDE